ncbi:putative invertase inhibitor [Typha latifolia]|uniref:putative invertase inhibitor n=1 Tax=Typha latifolia TaxID=4733 RepID=UPI003C2CF3B6
MNSYLDDQKEAEILQKSTVIKMAYRQTLLLFLCLSVPTQSFAHWPRPAGPAAGLLHVQGACNKTSYVYQCVQSLAANPESQGADRQGLIAISIRTAAEVAAGIATYIAKSLNATVNDKALWQCLNICSGSFEDAIQRLDISMAAMDMKAIIDIIRSMNAAMGDIETCDRGCKEVKGKMKEELIENIENFRKQCVITLDLAAPFG